MNSGNLTTVSNLSEKSNNHVGKKVYRNAGVVGTIAFTVFVGTTALRYPIEGETAFAYDITRPSYIQYINVGHSKGYADLYTNKAIDLVKVENINKIRKMALFDEDWNGTGGSAFSEEAINLFETIIDTVRRQPQIAPTGRNSLLMQYELDDKSLLAFEVSEKRTEKVYIPKGNYSLAQTEVFIENVSQKINKSVERFYGFE